MPHLVAVPKKQKKSATGLLPSEVSLLSPPIIIMHACHMDARTLLTVNRVTICCGGIVRQYRLVASSSRYHQAALIRCGIKIIRTGAHQGQTHKRLCGPHQAYNSIAQERVCPRR